MATQTLEQFIQGLKRLAEAIPVVAPDIAEKMAITGKSLVQERIQREGLPGEEYSTNEIPTFFFSGKERNSGGKAYIEENNMGTWGGFRKAQGLRNDRIDLTYTGRMFNGLVPIKRVNSGTRFTVVMGGSDKEVDDKLYFNTQRYGDFLQPNAEEQKEIGEIVDDEFEKLINKHLG